jgi:hypothetical protein
MPTRRCRGLPSVERKSLIRAGLSGDAHLAQLEAYLCQRAMNYLSDCRLSSFWLREIYYSKHILISVDQMTRAVMWKHGVFLAT